MIPKEQRVKFAVLGCGRIGKRHAEMIVRNPESELAALIDNRDKSLLDIDQYGVSFYPSLDAFLLSRADVDVVNIATPNGLHARHAFKALEARKHVVIEKPMSLKANDAAAVIRKASDVGRQVFIVMQNRFSLPSLWMKEMVNTGKLGKIYTVQINCYWNRDERYYKNGSWHGKKALDGGTLFTQFSHFIDTVYWLFGDIQNITARFANHSHVHLTEFEDSGIVVFDFANGGTGCLHFSTAVWDKNLESSITVIAENGSVKIGGQYMDRIEYCHVKDYAMPEASSTYSVNGSSAYQNPAQNHHYVIENVVNVLKGRSTISTTAREGMKVVEIIERIYDSVGDEVAQQVVYE